MWNRLAHSIQGSLQGEDGSYGAVASPARNSVANLEEQLMESENRNKMINEEFKRLLKDKQREIDSLKMKLEENGMDPGDSTLNSSSLSTLNDSALSRKVEEYEILLQQKDSSLQLLTTELREVENHKAMIEEQERKNTEKLMHELAGRISAHENISRKLEEMKHLLEEKDVAVRNMADQMGAQDDLLKARDESIKKLKRMAAGSEATEEMIVTLQKSVQDKDAKAALMLEQIDKLETENKILSGKISNRDELGYSKDETIQNLHKELRQKDELLRNTMEEKRSVDAKLIEMENEVRRTKKLMELKEGDISDLTTEKEKCQAVIQSHKLSIESMKEEHAKVIGELRDRLTETSELLRLRTEALDVMQQTDQERIGTVATLNAKIQELQNQVDTVGSTMTSELESEVAKREEMQRLKEETESRFQTISEEKEALCKKVAVMEEQVTEYEERLCSVKLDYDSLRDESLLKEENLQESLKESQTQSSELQSELNDTNTKLEESRRQLELRENECNQLSSQLEDQRLLTRDLEEKCDNYSSQLSALKAAADTLHQESSAQKQKNDDLMEEAQALKNEYLDHEKLLRQQISDLELDVESKKSENKELNEKLMSLQNENATLVHRCDLESAKLSALESDLCQKSTEGSALGEKLQNILDENQSLRKEVMTLEHHLDEKKKEREDTRAELNLLNEELNVKKAAISTDQQHLQDLSFRCTNLEETVQSLQDELNTVTSLKSAREETVADLEEALRLEERRRQETAEGLKGQEEKGAYLEELLKAEERKREEIEKRLEEEVNSFNESKRVQEEKVAHLEELLKAEELKREEIEKQLEEEVNSFNESKRVQEEKVAHLEELLKAEELKREEIEKRLEEEVNSFNESKRVQEEKVAHLEELLKAEELKREEIEKRLEEEVNSFNESKRVQEEKVAHLEELLKAEELKREEIEKRLEEEVNSFNESKRVQEEKVAHLEELLKAEELKREEIEKRLEEEVNSFNETKRVQEEKVAHLEELLKAEELKREEIEKRLEEEVNSFNESKRVQEEKVAHLEELLKAETVRKEESEEKTREFAMEKEIIQSKLEEVEKSLQLSEMRAKELGDELLASQDLTRMHEERLRTSSILQDELEERIRALEAESLKVKQSSKDMQEECAYLGQEKAALDEKLQTLLKVVDTKEEEVSEWQEKFAAADKEANEHKSLFLEAEDRNSALLSTLDAKENNVKDLQLSLTEQEEKCRFLEGKVGDLEAEKENAVSEMKRKMQDLEASYGDLKRQNEESVQDNGLLRKEKDTMCSILEGKDEEINRLQTSITDLISKAELTDSEKGSIQVEKEKLSLEISELKQQISTFEELLARKDREVVEHKSREEAKAKDYHALEGALKSRSKELEDANLSCEESSGKLKETLVLLGEKEQQTVQLLGKTDALAEEKMYLEERLVALETEKAELEETILQHVRRVEELSLECSELQSMVKELECQCVESKERCHQISEALEEEKRARADLMEAKETLASAYEQLREEQAELSSALDKANDQLAEDESESHRLQDEKALLENHQRGLEERIAFLEDQKESLENSDVVLQQSKAERERVIESLEEKNRVLTNSLADMEKVMEELVSKAGHMEHAMKSSSQEKDQLQECLRQAETRRVEIEQALEDFVKMTEWRKKRSDKGGMTEDGDAARVTPVEGASGYNSPSPKHYSPTNMPLSPGHSLWGSSENLSGGFLEGKTFSEIFQLVEEERCAMERKLDHSVREQNELGQQLEQTESLLQLEREKLKQVKEQYSQLQQFHEQKNREREELTASFEQQLRTARQYAEGLDSDRSNLESEVERLEVLAEQLQAEVGQKDEELQNCRNTIEGLHQEVKSAAECKESAEKIGQGLEETVARLQTEITGLTERISELSNDHASDAEKLKSKELELQRSREKQEQDMTKARKVMKKMKTAITEKEKEAAALGKEVETLTTSLTDKEGQLNLLEKQFNTLQTEYESTAALLNERNKLLEEKQEELERVQQMFAVYKEEKESLLAELRNENNTLKNTMFSLDATLADKENLNLDLERRYVALTERFADEQERLRQLQSTLDSRDEDARHLVEQKTQEAQNLSTRKEWLERSMEEKDMEILVLKESVSSAANELQVLWQTKEDLERSLNTTKEELEANKQGLESAEKSLSERADRETSLKEELKLARESQRENSEVISRLEDQLAALETALKNVNVEAETARQNAAEYKSELDVSLKNEEDLNKYIQEMRQDLNSKDLDLNTLRSELSTLTSELESKEKVQAATLREVESKEEVIQSLRDVKVTYENEIESLASSLKIAEERNVLVEKDLESRKREMEEAHTLVSSLNDALRENEEHRSELETKLASREEQVRTLTESYRALSDKLSEHVEEALSYKQKLRVAQEELAIKTESLNALESSSDSAVSTLKKTLEALEAEKHRALAELNSHIEELKADFYGRGRQASDDIKQLENHLTEQKSAVAALEDQVATCQDKIKEQEAAIALFQDERTTLIAEKEALSQRINEHDRSDYEIQESAAQKHSVMEARLQELGKELEAKDEMMNQLQSGAELQESALRELRETLSNLEVRHSDLLGELDRDREAMNNERCALEEKNAALQDYVAKISKLKEDLEQGQDVNKDLALKVEALAAENSSLLDNSEKYESIISDLKAALNEMTNEKNKLQARLLDENKTLREQLHNVTSEMDGISLQMAEKERSLESYQQQTDATAAVQDQLLAKEKELEELKSAYNAFKLKTKRKIQSMSEKLASEKAMVADKQILEQSFETRISETEKEKMSLVERINELQSKVTSLESTLVEKESLIASIQEVMQDTIGETARQETARREEHGMLQAALSEKDKKLEVLREELVRQEEELVRYSEEKEMLTSSLETKISNLELSLAETEQESVRAQKENTTLSSEIDGLFEQLAQANALIRELTLSKDESGRLKEMLESVTSSLNASQQEKEDLKSRFAKVMKKAQALKRELRAKDELIKELKEESTQSRQVSLAVPVNEMVHSVVEVEAYASNTPEEELPSAEHTTDNTKGNADARSAVMEGQCTVESLKQMVEEQGLELREKDKIIASQKCELEELYSHKTGDLNDSAVSSHEDIVGAEDQVVSSPERGERKLELLTKKYERQAENMDKVRKRLALMKKAEVKLGKENRELESKVQGLKKDLEEMTLINRSLNKEIEECHVSQGHLNTQNSEMKSLIDTLEKERQTLDADLQGISREILEVKEMREDLLAEINGYKQQLRRLNENYSEEQEKSARLGRENERLMEAFMDLGEERANLKARLETAEEEEANHKETAIRLQNELNQIREEIREKDGILEQFEAQVKMLDEARRSGDKEKEKIGSELDKRDEENDALREQVSERQKEVEQLMQDAMALNTEKTRLIEMGYEREAQIKQLEASLEMQTSQVSALTERLATVDASPNDTSISAAQSVGDQQEPHETSMDGRESHGADGKAEARTESVEDVKQQKDVVIAKLKWKLKQTMKNHQAAKSQLDSRIQALEREKEELLAKSIEHQETIERVDGAGLAEYKFGDVEQLTEELKSVIADRDALKVLHDELCHEKSVLDANLKDEIANLKNLLEAGKGDLEQVKAGWINEREVLEERLAQSASELLALSSLNEQQKVEKNEKEAEIDDLRAALDALRTENQSMEQKLGIQETELDLNAAAVRHLTSEMENARNEAIAFAADLEQERVERHNQSELLSQEVEERARQSQEADKKIASLRDSLQALEQEFSSKEEQVKKLQSQLVEVQEEKDRRERDLQDLKQQYSAALESHMNQNTKPQQSGGLEGVGGTIEFGMPVKEEIVERVEMIETQATSASPTMASTDVSSELAKLRVELETMKEKKEATLAKMKLKMRQIVKERDRLREDLETQRLESENRIKEIEDALNKREHFHATEGQKLKEDVAVAQTSLAEALGQVKELNKEITDSRQLVEAKNRAIGDLEEHVVELEGRLIEAKNIKQRLESEYSSLEERVEGLERQLKQSTNAKRKLEEEKTSMEELRGVLEETIGVNEKHVITLQTSLRDLTMSCEGLKSDLIKVRAEKDEAFAAVAAAKEECESQRQAFEMLKEEKEKLKEERDRIDDESNKVEESYRNEKLELSSVVEGKDGVILALQQETEVLQHSLQIAQRERDEFQSLYNAERNELTTLHDKLDEMKLVNSALEEKEQELVNTLETVKREHERYIGTSSDDRESLLKNFLEQENLIDSLRKELSSEREAKVLTSARENEERSALRDRLDTIVSEAEGLKEVNNELRVQSSSLQSVVDGLATRLGVTDTWDIENAVVLLQQRLQVHENNRRQVEDELKMTVEQRNKEVSEWNIMEEAHQGQAASYRREMEELGLILRETEMDRADIAKELNHTKSLLLTVEGELQQVQETMNGQKLRLQGVFNEMQIKEEEVKELQSLLNQERLANQVLRKEAQTLQNVAVPEMEVALSEKNESMFHLREEFEAIIADREGIIESLKERNSTLTLEMSEMRAVVEEKETAKANVMVENTQLRARVSDLEEERKMVDTKLAQHSGVPDKSELRSTGLEPTDKVVNVVNKESPLDSVGNALPLGNVKLLETLHEKLQQVEQERDLLQVELQKTTKSQGRVVGGAYGLDFDDISHGLREDIELALRERREIEVSFELDRLNLERQREEKIQEIKTLKAQLKKYGNEIKQKNTVIEELQSRLERVGDIASKEGYYLGLEERLASEREEIEVLNVRCRDMEKQLNQESVAHGELKQRFDNLVAEKDMLCLDFERRLQVNLLEHTEYCQRLRDEFEVHKDEKEVTISQLNAKIHDLEENILSLQSTNKEDMMSLQEKYKQRVMSLRENNDKLERERLQFRQDVIREVEHSHADIASQLRDEYQQMIDEKDQKIDELYEQFSDTQQFLYAAQDENVVLRSEIDDTRLEIKKALIMIDGLNREKEAMILAHTEEIGRMVKAKGKEFKELRQQFEEAMTSKDVVIEEQRKKLGTARDLCDSVEGKYKKAMTEKNQVMETLRVRESELDDLRPSLTTYVERFDALKDELQKQNNDVSDLCIMVEEKEKEAAFFKAQLHEKYFEIDKLQGLLADKTAELNDVMTARDAEIVETANHQELGIQDFRILEDSPSTPNAAKSLNLTDEVNPPLAQGVDDAGNGIFGTEPILEQQETEVTVEMEPVYESVSPNFEESCPEKTEREADGVRRLLETVKTDLMSLDENLVSEENLEELKVVVTHLNSLLMIGSRSANEFSTVSDVSAGTISHEKPHLTKDRTEEIVLQELEKQLRSQYDDTLRNLREDIQNALAENQVLQSQLDEVKETPRKPMNENRDAIIQTDVDRNSITFTDLDLPLKETIPTVSDHFPETKVKTPVVILPEVVAETLQGQVIGEMHMNSTDGLDGRNIYEDNESASRTQNMLNKLESKNAALQQELNEQVRTVQKLKQISKHYKGESFRLKGLWEQEVEALKMSSLALEQELYLCKTQNAERSQELKNLREEVTCLVHEKQELLDVHKNEAVSLKQRLTQEFNDRMETLKTKSIEDQQVIHEFETKNKDLICQVEHLAAEMASLSVRLESTKQEKESCEKSVLELDQRIKDMQQSLAHVECVVQEKEEIILGISSELADLRESTLPKSCLDAETVNPLFDEADLQKLRDEVARKANQVTELERKLTVIVEEKVRDQSLHSTELSSYQEAIANLKNSLERTIQEKMQVERDMQELRDDMEGLSNDKDSIALVWKERIQQLRADKEAEMKSMESEFGTVLSQRESELWESKVQVENLTSERFDLMEELSLVKEQLNCLQEQNTKMHEVNVEAMSEIQTVISAKKEVEHRLDEAERSNVSLNAQLVSTSESHAQELLTARHGIAALQSQVESLTQQLESKKSEVQTLLVDSQKKKDSLRKLKRELFSVRKDNQKLKDDINSEFTSYADQLCNENELLRRACIDKDRELQESRLNVEQIVNEKSYLESLLRSKGKIENIVPLKSALPESELVGEELPTSSNEGSTDQVVSTPEEERLRFQLSKLQSETKSNETIFENSLTSLRNEIREALAAKCRAEIEATHLRGLLKNFSEPRSNELSVDVSRLKNSVSNVKSDLATLRQDASTLCQGFRQALQETRQHAAQILQTPVATDVTLDTTDYRPMDDVAGLSFMDEPTTPPSAQQRISELEQTLDMWKSRCTDLEEQVERLSTSNSWGHQPMEEDSFLINMEDTEVPGQGTRTSIDTSFLKRVRSYNPSRLSRFNIPLGSLFSSRRATRNCPPLRRSAAMLYVVFLHAMALWAIYCSFRL